MKTWTLSVRLNNLFSCDILDSVFENSHVLLCLAESSYAIGTTIGCLLATPSMTFLGRRGTTLFITCTSYLVGFALITFGFNVLMILVGRVLTGIGLGVTLSVPMVYIVEIVDPKMVSVLGVVPNLFAQVGILATYVMGIYFSWKALALASKLPKNITPM